MKISKDEAILKIFRSKGKLFSVEFIKRTTGERRRMVARRGVKKGVTGEGMAFNPYKRGLIPVCEFKEDRDSKGRFKGGTQFRMVSTEGLTKLRIGGETYEVQ